MASPLNRLPFGLLDFFGIKAGEWGPRELSQVLQPGLDLLRWYTDTNALDVIGTVQGSPFGQQSFAQRGITATAPSDLSGLVTAAQLEVPNNETWLFLEADIRWGFPQDPTANARWGLSSGQINVTGQAHWDLETQGWDVGVAGSTRSGSATLKQPRWVLPGQRISATCWGTQGPAASMVVTTHFRLVRFLR